MKVTVIGYRSGFPKAGEATSCYLIQEDNVNIVIDLGSGSLSILQKYINLQDLDALIITHYHPDHFSDVFCLQQGIMIKNDLGELRKKLTIYAPEDTFYFKQFKKDFYIKAERIDESKEINMNNIKIKFLKTKHPIFGLAVKLSNGEKTIVYTSDTEINDDLIKFSLNCSLLITECSLYNNPGGIEGHMDIEDVKELIKYSNPDNVLLTHLPPYGDNMVILQEVQSMFNKKMALAETGLVWE